MGSVLLSGRFGCSSQQGAASVFLLMLEAGESCPLSRKWDSAFTPQMLHQTSEKLKYEQMFSEIKEKCIENIAFVF